MWVIRTALLGLSMCLAQPVAADPLKDAEAAYKRGDWAAAMRANSILARKGNAEAQFNLAVGYWNGLGVRQNHTLAAKWLNKAAEQGMAKAQSSLAVFYRNGAGVPQNYILAHMWGNLAAAQGESSGVEERDLAASKMTQAQIARAQDLAKQCLRKNYKDC